MDVKAHSLDLARRTVLAGSLWIEGALRGSVVLAEPDRGGHELRELTTRSRSSDYFFGLLYVCLWCQSH